MSHSEANHPTYIDVLPAIWTQIQSHSDPLKGILRDYLCIQYNSAILRPVVDSWKSYVDQCSLTDDVDQVLFPYIEKTGNATF